MKYYIKTPETEQVQGPFTVDELNQGIANRTLSPKARATTDIGESRERVAKSPARDWISLSGIPGIIGATSDGEMDSRRIPPILHCFANLIIWFHVLCFVVQLPLVAISMVINALPGSMMPHAMFLAGINGAVIMVAIRLRAGKRFGLYGLALVMLVTFGLILKFGNSSGVLSSILWAGWAGVYLPTLVIGLCSWSHFD